jgi:pimeloyl-ACP methyl ester carboxylesterase
VGGDEGWPRTWYAWRKIMPTFTSGFRAIAVDPRGLDHSSDRNKGDTGRVAADLHALMRRLGADRRLSVIDLTS